MEKEIGMKVWEREDGILRRMYWISDGKTMVGKDEPYET